nr:uncharacterized protein si:dkey-111e8.5 [Misgurnus anguillicaudatus]
MAKVTYFISAPSSVEKVAEQFRRKLKQKKNQYRHLQKLKTVHRIEECKFVLVFFPVIYGTGTDIEATLNEVEKYFKDKPVILVALHHTFDPEKVVSGSSKFVERDNTLTLDCLFYEDTGLLQCERNSTALKDAAGWIKSNMQRL